MKGKLSDYYGGEDETATSYPALASEFALARAMGAGVKELEMTQQEFVWCLRYAINSNLYKQIFAPDGTNYPTILAMKIIVI
jgi:hypothetical protein